MFGVAAAAKNQPLWVEKTNKSELWNCLTYRVLISIFEVVMKTFFSQLRNFEIEIPIWKYFYRKNGLFFFFWGWRLNFVWAHVITQDICNKFIDSKCWHLLLQPPQLCGLSCSVRRRLLKQERLINPYLTTLRKISEVTLETKLLFVTLQYMLYSNINTKTMLLFVTLR